MSNKLTIKDYHIAFLQLTKTFINEDVSIDEYLSALHILLENYRKDIKNGKS